MMPHAYGKPRSQGSRIDDGPNYLCLAHAAEEDAFPAGPAAQSAFKIGRSMGSRRRSVLSLFHTPGLFEPLGKAT